MFKKILFLVLLFIPFSLFGYSSNSYISDSFTIPPNGYYDLYFNGTGGVYNLSSWSSPIPLFGQKFLITSISSSGTGNFEIFDNPSFLINNHIFTGNNGKDILVNNMIKLHNLSLVPVSININGFFFASGSSIDNNYIIYNTSSGSTSLVEFSGNGVSVNKDFYYTFFNMLLILFFVFLFSWKVILFVYKKL